ADRGAHRRGGARDGAAALFARALAGAARGGVRRGRPDHPRRAVRSTRTRLAPGGIGGSMGGVAGWIAGARRGPEPEALGAMLAALAHRGGAQETRALV